MPESTPKTIAECKVTYFIGKMLARAGMLSLNSDGLMFIPTALDRAIGSIDIPIPISEIQEFYYNDTFQKTLQIKSPDKIHKFIGSGLNELHENLIVLKRQTSGPDQKKLNLPNQAKEVPSDSCSSCSKSIQKFFKFCPHCRTQLKNLCPECKSEVEVEWIACPQCNCRLKDN